MQCPHCLQGFTPKAQWVDIGRDVEGSWGIEHHLCPNEDCQKRIAYLVRGTPIRVGKPGHLDHFENIAERILIRPKGSNHPPVPSQVPSAFAEDYNQSCLVLNDSPKASAALSRRCLQNLLREKAEVKPSNLANEIQEVIDSGKLPTYLTETVDAVRNIGNFAAHPIKSEKSGEIIDVEPAEAEWNLDVLESLFDFYFVQPDIVRKKKEALNSKLEDSGQKPMK